jgi:hypothetical protein
MKKILLFLSLIFVSYSFSQSVNDFKAVVVPIKYDFLKNENEYRLNTLTKFNLKKAGFPAFYNNETMPSEYNDRCSLLYVDVKQEKAFLATKLSIVFKDCKGLIIFQSEIGRSKEKEFQTAYSDALNNAFQSVYDLNYKYTPSENVALVSEPATKQEVVPAAVVPVEIAVNVVKETKFSESNVPNLLYAQPTSYGYQLIDSEPKVVMKVYKTSNPASYMATKGSVQGVLVAKDNQWYFEYYQNDQLVSEKINVKF